MKIVKLSRELNCYMVKERNGEHDIFTKEPRVIVLPVLIDRVKIIKLGEWQEALLCMGKTPEGKKIDGFFAQDIFESKQAAVARACEINLGGL